jgi:dipeptidyl aminopeptidase/acylaminoacyl peptidase
MERPEASGLRGSPRSRPLPVVITGREHFLFERLFQFGEGSGYQHIQTIHRSGRDLDTLVLPDVVFESDPDWSPDGKRIGFQG